MNRSILEYSFSILVVMLFIGRCVYVESGYCVRNNNFISEESVLENFRQKYYKIISSKLSDEMKEYLTYSKFISITSEDKIFITRKYYWKSLNEAIDKYFSNAQVAVLVDFDKGRSSDEVLNKNGGFLYYELREIVLSNCGDEINMY